MRKMNILPAVVCGLTAGYLLWSFAYTLPPKDGVVSQAAPAVMVPKVAGPVLTKPLQVVPRAAVEKKFGPALTIPQDEEVIDTAEIPRTENGVETVTFMNLSTGTARTVYVPKPAPWFALEDHNTLGTGYEAGTEGSRIPFYYRRDLLRVKDLHLVGELGGKIPVGPGRLEGHATAAVEWRF